MPCLSATAAALTVANVATQAAIYAQCGGTNWTGATECVSGATCVVQNPFYSQCVASSDASAFPSSMPALMTSVSQAPVFSSSMPVAPTISVPSVSHAASSVSMSIASSSAPVVATTSAAAELSSAVASTVAAVIETTSSTSVASTTSAAAASTASSTASGLTKFAGINIAGFDFGCSTDGTCTVSGSQGPITSTNNGTAQMVHFVNDDNLNIFRLSVGWQYLTNDVVGGDLDATNFANYDVLMQACLATGSHCAIDIHNYARWNGEIIGQGGPTNDEFTALWTSLATKYASETKVIFGVMNEPHDVTVSTWAETVQAAVTAIRNAGATSQYITLPGSDYQSAGSFISDGSAAALLGITNPDGTTTNLIFDVHKYLDSDNSGTSTECVTNNIDDAFSPLATWLRKEGRMAILTETGGGNVASCEKYVCEEIAYLNANSDVYLGYIGWAAGGFDDTYALDLTPTGADFSTDTALAAKCFAR
ncbi:glycoside hydrolase superfamily [Pseudomassariella vexata]|uniref:Endoglucanase EG-II n=1 Tax=Pseudomassariella vexata TaxID=1141098 RepID=A0A1Y2DAS0_9PEZI|nr:glycoside hydrolase superfamily [Pseudomassariella vexata]ORY56371.1 glycoside hydrolase superfamily [Pseudomassariella vexata]